MCKTKTKQTKLYKIGDSLCKVYIILFFRIDNRHSRMDEQDKERKEKHKEWMRKKDEEMRRKLMKVYGPTPVFDPCKYCLFCEYCLFCKYCLFYHRFLINLYQLSIKNRLILRNLYTILGTLNDRPIQFQTLPLYPFWSYALLQKNANFKGLLSINLLPLSNSDRNRSNVKTRCQLD